MSPEQIEEFGKRKGILKTIKGIVADCKLNRNGRIYPRQLWENVINSDYVKELLASKTLFGETDHPAERLEMSLQEVSHCISDIQLEGDNVIATIDVLDTPNGNLISICPDAYDIICFDGYRTSHGRNPGGF